MAVIEITCPHCSARTYVTFVRQTGNGSCPECGNEITDVFQYSSNPTSGTGTLLTEDFVAGGATIVPGGADSGDGQDLFGDAAPASLPLLDPSSAPSLVPKESAPALELSQSGPSLMPLEKGLSGEPSDSGPMLVPSESAPMLVPSNSAPTLIPSNSSASARVEGILLTPPPPRLRQFAAEDSSTTKTKRPTAEINLEEQPVSKPAEDSPTRPTLPPVPVAVPQRSSQTKAVRRPTGSLVAAAQPEGEPAPVVARVPTGRVQKSPTGPVVKPATGSIAKPPAPKRPTASIPPQAPASLLAATRRPTSPLPSREVTRPVAPPVAPRKPTASLGVTRRPTGTVKAAPVEDALAPAEELSLFTPPPPKAAPATRAVPPRPRQPTATVAKAAPGTRAVPPSAAESGGRSYAPIRVPGGPPSPVSSQRPPEAPPKRPTAKLSVVGLGEAPRLAAPDKPKDFAKPKFDAGLTRLGYTMPGSDVSHFDGLPEPSPVPYGVDVPEDDAPPEPAAPGPRPGTRAAMPRPSAPVPKAPPPPPEEDLDNFAQQQDEDAPAALVSKADINEDWAPSGPDSGVLGNVEIPGDLDDVVDESAATTVPEIGGKDEIPDDEFEAEAETRPLLKQEKPEKKKPRPAPDDEPRRVYASRPSFDWEKFRYNLFVGTIYTVCALALAAFVLGLYHVHVKPLF